MREFYTAKWRRYNVLKESEAIASHLPKTRQLSKTNFMKLIHQYGEVVVKPNDGRRGRGVFKVSYKGNGKYEIHIEDRRKTIRGIHESYAYIVKQIGSEDYIVQRRIPLAHIDGCIIDFRVIVQRRSTKDPWKVTAKVVKMAGKGYIVTNLERSGGTILHVSEAIERSTLKNVSRKKLVSKIDWLVLKAAKKLTKYYTKQRIYGFDIGVDNHGYVWIIEANLDPMLSHFSHLKDKTLYYRILDYKRGY